ncbi:conserved hypothetical protein [Methanocaldococcus vulcanius M7]|uniref:Uncharacterized protein n=1 Tax=Methanocaldococcus vulcanius (strain ATCC 700851 / DSM 12094 / M7) TaxID=579137 RepID=C9RFG3_METVM|nr:hypothetical protein [Methanocaldococcus vulcanius]ACX72315.1 conserved hypothetical protein [Methanocaldococcus vulcanius M7]
MEKQSCKKGIDSTFVSALYYSINKAIYDVIGEGGKVLGRRSSYEMIKMLKDLGYLKENMSNEEIEDLFVNVFGLSEGLGIHEDDKMVVFDVIKPTLDLFLKRLMEENLKPYVCPFMYLLSEIYGYSNGCRLMLSDVIPESEEMVKLVFKKI